jgi:pimeloyl-ACP methyl ester carboxylesterase
MWLILLLVVVLCTAPTIASVLMPTQDQQVANTKLSPTLQEWYNAGELMEIGDFQVFVLDVGDATADPDDTIFVFHGFPESSYSFHKVLSGLTEQFERVILFDFIGFGFSDKPSKGFEYTLSAHADTALEVWRKLGSVRGGHLLATDMGDTVATELVARDNENELPDWFTSGFQSLTFTNGGMAVELANLSPFQLLLASPLGFITVPFAIEPFVMGNVEKNDGSGKLTDDDLDLMWENLTLQKGNRKMWLLGRYYNDRFEFEQSRYHPALAATTLPVHIMWGEGDVIHPIDVANFLVEEIFMGTDPALTIIPGGGHFIALTVPNEWMTGVRNFYNSL